MPEELAKLKCALSGTLCLTAVVLLFATAAVAQDPNACDDPLETPDLIVGQLDSVMRFGEIDGIAAYAIGATSCNLGSCWVDWFASTNRHPVFAMNLFRLADGRYEQIGQSWVVHRFFALSGILCEPGCIPTNGQHLGVDCSTSNSASATGSQFRLGPKSEIDASTGSFPFPFTGEGETGSFIFRRLQVRNTDLDPLLNPGARYFIEAQNVTEDDALAGNGNNNASYREVVVTGTEGVFNLGVTGPTHSGEAAIRAWVASDPGVVLDVVDVPDDGRLYVASRAVDLGGGLWRYEYAIQNLNSHRSLMSVSVPVPFGAGIGGTGFHDVDYHSGEPYDGTDWPVSVTSGADPPTVAWSTQSHAVDPTANALRWGTLYNFRLEVAAAPVEGKLTLGLFRPGTPAAVTAAALIPDPCDDDGSCGPGEDACLCSADCGAPPPSEFVCGDLGDDDCDTLVDCADPDCCFDPLCPADDLDGDSRLSCEDCDDVDDGIWATPSAVRDLVLSRGALGGTILSWNAPLEPGGAEPRYETLRSIEPDDFVTDASCIEFWDPTATMALDGEDPATGGLFCYLPRATNGCPDGVGSLGVGTQGSARAARSCP